MSMRITIAAAAITILIAPAPGFAQATPKANVNAMAGAYGAANQSRAKRSALRGRVAQATDASIYRVISPDGRLVGADPDAAIRFELRRDPNLCRY